MDIENSEKIDLAPHQEDYIEVENHCCLCGTELIFHHEIDSLDQSVKENASCPSCGIQLKEREHLLH